MILAEVMGWMDNWWHTAELGGNHPPITRVARIQESPFRLPVKLANKMHRAGESRMGGCDFSLVLTDGRRLPYSTGDIVDFPDLPSGVDPEMVADLIPHEGPDENWKRRWKAGELPPHLSESEGWWCVFTDPILRAPITTSMGGYGCVVCEGLVRKEGKDPAVLALSYQTEERPNVLQHLVFAHHACLERLSDQEDFARRLVHGW